MTHPPGGEWLGQVWVALASLGQAWGFGTEHGGFDRMAEAKTRLAGTFAPPQSARTGVRGGRARGGLALPEMNNIRNGARHAR